MGARNGLVIPFIHHLFFRPRPVPKTLPDGRTLWRCASGASWVEE